MRSSWAFMVLRLASIFCTVGLTSAAGGVAAGLAGAAGVAACAAFSGWWASSAQAGLARASAAAMAVADSLFMMRSVSGWDGTRRPRERRRKWGGFMVFLLAVPSKTRPWRAPQPERAPQQDGRTDQHQGGQQGAPPGQAEDAQHPGGQQDAQEWAQPHPRPEARQARQPARDARPVGAVGGHALEEVDLLQAGLDDQEQDGQAAGQQPRGGGPQQRSEERRVGKECRSRWSPYH